ncbi:MAG: MauE/DoxX family redox-associated membrane protein [Actinomycetota bacterium]
MVETINPVVHGGSRSRYGTALALHVVGATGAASIFGALVGGVGALLGAPWGRAGVLVVAFAAAVYLVRETFGVPVPVLEARRQVPDWWRTFFSRNVTALLYGAGVGIGFLTYLGHGTLLVVSVAALASGRPLVGALLIAPFGLARGLTIGIGAWTDDPSGLVNRLAAFARRGWPRLAHGVVLAAVVVSATFAARKLQGGDGTEVAAAALAIAFAWAAVSKVVSPRSWRRALSGYGLPAPLERVAAITVPLAEGSVPLLVLAGSPRTAAITAAALLLVFSGAILVARARRRADLLPCGCFGGARVRDYRAMLARNAVLAGVAVVAAVGGSESGVRPRIVAPGREDLLPAAIVVVCVAVASWTLGRGLTVLRRTD